MAGLRIEWDDAALTAQLASASEAIAADAAEAVAAEARRLAPVKSGRLRDSIAVTTGRDDEGVYGDVSADATDEKGRPYPLFVEVGTQDAPAEPYLRPALDALKRK